MSRRSYRPSDRRSNSMGFCYWEIGSGDSAAGQKMAVNQG